ncbi:DUF305 domain-containing protein [Saccharopolyspora cebuensis]|uniref:DUF305 domain-containing protein n=1 Tax=Saccharopolyspora cebuensis TaxID=418759 RepID=A0ABV4CKI0_9PSEU
MPLRSVLGTAALALALTGCAAAEPEPQPAPVVLPGAPGDRPEVVTGAEVPARTEPRPVAVEADYLRDMIAHHGQALEMTALAPERAAHPQVRALAERIGGAQGPEIDAMRGWLATHSLPEHPTGETHGHGHEGHTAMPGMATPEQLAALAAAHGAEFDRLFLDLMIAHHEGAVTMATDLLAEGRDPQVHAMAQDVLVTQRDEIATMQRLRHELP